MAQPKIPDQTALQIFQLHYDGVQTVEISKRLRVNRLTINAHLRGEYSYSPSVERKIAALVVDRPRKPEPVFPDGFISLRKSRLLLPFTPSETAIYALSRHKWFRTRTFGSRRLTKPAWIKTFIRHYYGVNKTGVAVCSCDLDTILLDPLTTRQKMSIPSFSIQNKTRTKLAHMLYDVRDSCELYGVRFQIPTIALSNTLAAMSLGASFVLLSERMFCRQCMA